VRAVDYACKSTGTGHDGGSIFPRTLIALGEVDGKARARRTLFVSGNLNLGVHFGVKGRSVTGGSTMGSIARPVHALIVFAAFLFVGAIVLGAL
jgi:hypothetical protein